MEGGGPQPVTEADDTHGAYAAGTTHGWGWGDLLPLLRIAHGTGAPDEGVSREGAKARSRERRIPLSNP